MLQAEISKEKVIDLENFSLQVDSYGVAFIAVATVSDKKKHTVYAFGSRPSNKCVGAYNVKPTIFIRKFKDKAKANLYHKTIEDIIACQAWRSPSFVRVFFGRTGEIEEFYNFVRNQNSKILVR